MHRRGQPRHHGGLLRAELRHPGLRQQRQDLAAERRVTDVDGGPITTNAKIDGKHTKAAPDGNGTSVSLIATGLGAGSDITINKKINTSGRLTSGAISIDADGDVQLNHQIIARGQGGSAPTATGGTITVHADGTVSSAKRGKIIARGKKKVTQAGVVDVSGDLGVDLEGRIEARGLFGGSVAATSATGNLRSKRRSGPTGSSAAAERSRLSAPAGTLTITGKKGAIKAQGGAPAAAARSPVRRLDRHQQGHQRPGHRHESGRLDRRHRWRRRTRHPAGHGRQRRLDRRHQHHRLRHVTGTINADGRVTDGGNVS